jgi:toxin ParE1/3/4
MGRVTRNCIVDRDLRGIAGHIAADNLTAALNWLVDIERVFRLLALQPEVGERVHGPRLGDVRRHVTGNYVIYYRPYSYGVRIVRVIHGARDHKRLI